MRRESTTKHLKDCYYCGSRPRRYKVVRLLCVECTGCKKSFTNHIRWNDWADKEWNKMPDNKFKYKKGK